MGAESPKPHMLMISFPGQGHVNPLLRLAKRVAAKGVLVTFTTTCNTGEKILSSSDIIPGDDGVTIGLGRLRFEFLSVNFDDGKDLDEAMLHLETEGPSAFSDLIKKQSQNGRPVTCVVNNPFVPWAVDVAADMAIPCAVLWVQSCAVFSTYYHYHHRLVEFPSEDNPNISVSLPGIPTMSPQEIPSFLLPSNSLKSLKTVILQQFKNIDKASWVFANSFEELEHEAIEAVMKFYHLIPVGPLVEPDDESKSSIKADLIKATDCMDWLDKQSPQSVIYISLGSIVAFTKEEMEDIAMELKTNNRPFLWVVRPECREFLPEKFLEDINGRGLVVGWSPQESVLNHSSIGCFLTHCGWNSALETISAGVTVIAYPQFGDQITDAKFFVDVYKIGVRLKAPVDRKSFHQAVEDVMDGAEAEEMRKRAAKLKEMAKKAIVKGGSSDRYIEEFVDEIKMRALGGSDLCV
ncbi:hypothetical protein LUZ60_017127 [Juncus effusus]|nr:hypothetical protein LUZ60_017127 [Juncus effusus]